MAKILNTYTYGFDDVNLVPASESEIRSRRDVDTSSEILKEVKLDTPMIASPMATVCESKLAIAASKAGAIGVIHRFNTIRDQVEEVLKVVQADARVIAAVGTGDDTMDRVAALVECGVSGILVDVAFLNNEKTIDIIKKIKDTYGNTLQLISGNVCTYGGFRAGCEAGLDAIRVGIGNGGNCRTSRVTGVGRGIITAICDAKEAQSRWKSRYGKYVRIWADGGINIGADFCKAMAAGADGVIMGRQFAATFESPAKYADHNGDIVELSDKEAKEDFEIDNLYKEYMGSASFEAQYKMGKQKKDIITSEGVKSVVKVYGSVADVVVRFNGAIRSSMSYLGATTLEQYRERAIFELVTEGMLKQQKARGLRDVEITI